MRPLLAIKWIEKESAVVPMEFSVLVERCVNSTELKESIENLLERKKRGQELDLEPRIKVISDFVESELERLETKVMESMGKPDTEELNNLFRMALNEAG